MKPGDPFDWEKWPEVIAEAIRAPNPPTVTLDIIERINDLPESCHSPEHCRPDHCEDPRWCISDGFDE